MAIPTHFTDMQFLHPKPLLIETFASLPYSSILSYVSLVTMLRVHGLVSK